MMRASSLLLPPFTVTKATSKTKQSLDFFGSYAEEVFKVAGLHGHMEMQADEHIVSSCCHALTLLRQFVLATEV